MNRKILAIAVAVLTGLFFYSACTKLDTTDIGNDLIPAVDNVNTFDTVLDVISDNLLYPDSTRIRSGDLHGIGVIANDPEFGLTQGASFFSVIPGFYGAHPFVNRDSIIAIDSIVLSLPYSTLYGDSNSVEQFEVYEIDQTFDFRDSAYPIKTPQFPLAAGGPIGTRLVTFNQLNDSVTYVNFSSTSATVYDTVKTVNQLRIRLNPEWGDKFLAFDTAVEYKNDSSFRVNFRGLAVKVNQAASPAPNAVAYFSLAGTAAATVTFYSRIKKDGQVDTIAPAFSFNGRKFANTVYRTEANNYLTALNNGTPNDNLIYIQSSPGSVATVKIPGLEGLSNRVIHRAELILEKIPSLAENFYTPSPLLFIDAVNNAGDSTFTIRNDFLFTGQGTGYDIGTLEGNFKDNRYTFNLSRYVQSIVTKKLRSHTLRVYAPFETFPYFESGTGTVTKLPGLAVYATSPIGAYRVVVGGGNHPTNKMRLRIIYSKI